MTTNNNAGQADTPHPGKVVLITGAARRLGAATARELHDRGWRVLVHCRQSLNTAEALAAELNAKRHDSCRVLQADLGRDAEAEKLAREALGVFARVDALINNASAFYPTPVGTTTSAQWDDLFSSNARAPFFLAQALVPELKRRRGAIVNLIDIHAKRPLREHTVYCMAKAAHAMLTLSLAKELAPEIRVNGVAPGAILWPDNQSMSTGAQEKILQGIPLQRLGEPQDIARTIAFLLEDSPYITGQIIAVDGGRRL
ncbi:MAG: pteridine reductase [bacterium]|nr:pteridine reductase [bacterium]